MLKSNKDAKVDPHMKAKPSMTLSEHLHSMISSPCSERPFVCDGLPESCTVIILGENSTTKMNEDWWNFWTDSKGFDLAKFESRSKELRVIAGERPISKTRSQLNRFRSKGLNCLETNAYINERSGGHGADGKPNHLLEVLIASLPALRAIIAHGKDAKERMERLPLAAGVMLYTTKHLIYLSHKDIDGMADEILASIS